MPHQSEKRCSLESKAQNTSAIAGIFIAAAFAFVRDFQSQMVRIDQVILTISITSLVISVFFSILVLWLRKLPLPIMGSMMRQMVEDLNPLGSSFNDTNLSEGIQCFINDQVNVWEKVDKKNLDINNRKVRCLGRAHFFLVTAIVGIAIVTFKKIATSGGF